MKIAPTILLGVLAFSSVSCSDTADALPDSGTRLPDAREDANVFAGAAELDVPIPTQERVHVNLAQSAVVAPAGDPRASTEWDLAFEGFDAYTNSGASGAGNGGAFGPLDVVTFVEDTAPSVPFISADKAAGAFLDWYAYDETAHILYSRFHVYGVKNGPRLWKVQILTYYGEQRGSPVGALYTVRYAEVIPSAGPTRIVTIDGTAGGASAPPTAPSGCLDLATGTTSTLTMADAQASSAWDLCFRRDAVSVNGEAGGPRGVTAVDLEANKTSSETLAQVKAKTPDTELPLFDGINASSFAIATFRGDHVVSAFESGGWLDASSSLPSPRRAAWLVVDARRAHKFLVAFPSFRNATTSSAGVVVMRIKPVNG
jgi:hypothetical protein